MSERSVIDATNLSKSKEKWQIEWDAEGVSFSPVDDPRRRLRVYRKDLASTVEATPVFGSLALVVKHPAETVKLKVDGEARRAYEREARFGADQLRASLVRRYKFALPVAVVVLLGSLPMESAGLALDPVGFGLALVLGALWLWSRRSPHPAILLVDSAWFSVVAVRWAMPRIGEPSIFAWVMCGLTALFAINGVQEYFRHKRANPAAAEVETA